MYKTEKNFIIGFLRSFVNDEDDQVLGGSDMASLDWHWLMPTLREHRILPFVGFLLESRGILQDLPEEARKEIEKAMCTAERNVFLRGIVFNKVVHLLGKNKIRVAPLKGTAYSSSIYRDMPFRSSNDIDILIEEKDMMKTLRYLLSNGFRFRSKSKKVAVSRNKWLEEILELDDGGNCQIDGVNIGVDGRKGLSNKGISLDVHWKMKYIFGRAASDVDCAAVWRRASNCHESGENIYLLSQKDHILFSVLNTAECHAPRLFQILDIAMLIKNYAIKPLEVSSSIKSEIPVGMHDTVDSLFMFLSDWFVVGKRLEDFSDEGIRWFDTFLSRNSLDMEARRQYYSVNDPAKDPVSCMKRMMRMKVSFWKWCLFFLGYVIPNYYNPNYSLRPEGNRAEKLFERIKCYGRHWIRQ